eukprot:bmy_08003T0
MIIYRELINHDEMLSDIYKIREVTGGAAEQIKHILAHFKNGQFFTGENMNPDGLVALLDYREDGVTPCMISFKEGLGMEKCEQIWLLPWIYHLSS